MLIVMCSIGDCYAVYFVVHFDLKKVAVLMVYLSVVDLKILSLASYCRFALCFRLFLRSWFFSLVRLIIFFGRRLFSIFLLCIPFLSGRFSWLLLCRWWLLRCLRCLLRLWNLLLRLLCFLRRLLFFCSFVLLSFLLNLLSFPQLTAC